MATIDLPATRVKMALINKNAFLRECARRHPEHEVISQSGFSMLLNGDYDLTTPKAVQVLNCLREFGFLVEHDDVDKAA